MWEQALNAVPALAECLALSLADMSDEEMEEASDPVTLPLTPLGPGIDKE